MRLPRFVTCSVVLLILFVGLPAFVYFVIYDHQNAPFCHKAAGLGLLSYLDALKTNDLPNVDGSSAKTLLSMHKYMGDEPWEEEYRYVPGLRKGDPGDLIYMYFAQPTRYTWHGFPQTIFADKKWIILPLDFAEQHSGISRALDREMPYTGECSELLSYDEFRRACKRRSTSCATTIGLIGKLSSLSTRHF